MSVKKIGQAWGFDLLVASVIFFFGLLFFYFYTINYSSGTESVFYELSKEGEMISNSFLSEGAPRGWSFPPTW